MALQYWWSRSDPWHCPPFAKLISYSILQENFPRRLRGMFAPPFFLGLAEWIYKGLAAIGVRVLLGHSLNTLPAGNHTRFTPSFAFVLKFFKSLLSNSTLSGSRQYDVHNALCLGMRLGLLCSVRCFPGGCSPEISWIDCAREIQSPQLDTPCSTSRSRSSPVGYSREPFSNPRPPS